MGGELQSWEITESTMNAREALRQTYLQWLEKAGPAYAEPLIADETCLGEDAQLHERLARVGDAGERVRLAWDAWRAGMSVDLARKVTLDAAHKASESKREPSGGLRGSGVFGRLFLFLAAEAVEGADVWLTRAAEIGERLADQLLNDFKLPEWVDAPANIAGVRQSDERDIGRVFIEHRASDCFLRLYERTAEPVFLIAARKLLEVAASDLQRLDHGYAVLAIWRYCESYDDGYFDEYARIAAERHMPAAGVQAEVSGELSFVDAAGERLPHPLLYLFYGRLVGKDAYTSLGYRLAEGALRSLIASAAPAEKVARWCRSTIGAQGKGGVVDLLTPGRFWAGG